LVRSGRQQQEVKLSIKSELLALQQTNSDGILHAAEVVAWARKNTESRLHAAIEWDDATAAEAHRLWQVRQLIQIHVVADDGAPTLVSLSLDRKAGGGYRSISDVAKRPDLRDIMLQDALDELNRVQAKYQRVTELASVWQEAEQIRTRTRRKRAA
jgi:hypothetical protein